MLHIMLPQLSFYNLKQSNFFQKKDWFALNKWKIYENWLVRHDGDHAHNYHREIWDHDNEEFHKLSPVRFFL